MQEIEKYLPQYIQKKAKEHDSKLWWQGKREKYVNFKKWIKSLKEETKEEKKKRLENERLVGDNEDSDVNMDDF